MFLRGCDHIVHAGDVGDPEILRELSKIASLTVVRGNTDKGHWAEALPETAMLEFGPTYIYVVHDLAALDISPKAAGVSVVVYGHSHQPLIDRRDGVIYVNPGSAGPRRFRLPIAMAELTITNQKHLSPRIIELEVNE